MPNVGHFSKVSLTNKSLSPILDYYNFSIAALDELKEEVKKPINII